MARGRRKGIVIAGGGLSACLAALAMARLRPDVPLLVVEEGKSFGGVGYRLFPEAELGGEAGLLGPLALQRWPGFYVSFPGFSRNLKSAWAGFAAADLHKAMVETLDPKQYRLGAKVVAVREDALVLDGGEEIRADGAIDARGAPNLSALELIHEARIERVFRLRAPHGLDRPVLADATVEQAGGLRYMQLVPLGPDRLRVADICLSERAEPDPGAAARLDSYLAKRGWEKRKAEALAARVRPLPVGGDLAALWRQSGAHAAKLGLRGGFVDPFSGRAIGDALRTARLLVEQVDYSGAVLHDVFEAEAMQVWRERELQRTLAIALAEGRRATLERLYRLDPALIHRLQAGRLGLLDRMRVQRALR